MSTFSGDLQNYLRHELSSYEAALQKVEGKVGVSDAYCDIKENVLRVIAAEYDWLFGECYQQIERIDKEIWK